MKQLLRPYDDTLGVPRPSRALSDRGFSIRLSAANALWLHEPHTCPSCPRDIAKEGWQLDNRFSRSHLQVSLPSWPDTTIEREGGRKVGRVPSTLVPRVNPSSFQQQLVA